MSTSDLIYSSIKFYFHFLLTLFYRSMKFVNIERVPRQGPVVIYSNHQNHVTDGMVNSTLIKTFIEAFDRQARILTSAQSLKRPGIGHYLRGSKVIKVERSEDIPPQSAQGKIKEIK